MNKICILDINTAKGSRVCVDVQEVAAWLIVTGCLNESTVTLFLRSSSTKIEITGVSSDESKKLSEKLTQMKTGLSV